MPLLGAFKKNPKLRYISLSRRIPQIWGIQRPQDSKYEEPIKLKKHPI